MDEGLTKLLPLLPILDMVGRTGHVTAAADLLQIPQPTVSRALARAGNAAGSELVRRDGRGIRLTPAARTLLPYIRRSLNELEAGLTAVREQSEQASGTIAVAFQNTFGEATLPILIRAFMRDHPGVKFDLVQGAHQLCLTVLGEGTADLALVSPVPAKTRGLRWHVLYSEPLRLVVPLNHPLAQRSRIKLAEVRREGFISMGHGFGLRSLCDDLCRQAGFRPRITFEGTDAHTLRGLVSAGLGISILPPSGADHLTPSVLGWRELEITDPVSRREIALVWTDSEEPFQVGRFRKMIIDEGPKLLGTALSGAGLSGTALSGTALSGTALDSHIS